MERKPLKRHQALIPLSKDHHLGLLLCWKIRMGFKKGLNEKRILEYTSYFFKHHLLPHFRIEEEHVFSSLPQENSLRKEAERQHEELHTMMERLPIKDNELYNFLSVFEQSLEKHIRFEERELFMHIQQELSESELEDLRKRVAGMHEEYHEQWEDRFWE